LNTVNTFAFRFIAVVGGAVVAMALLGTGTSAAKDPYIGKTYADASAAISGKGGNPVISTVVGSQLPTDQCIVESWHKVTYVSGDNFDHDNRKFMLALNCSAKLAHSGLPGHSLASAEGRAENALEVTAQRFNDDPTRCEKNLESCQKFCDKYGLCSKAVLALF
jgi:hypothetical protein